MTTPAPHPHLIPEPDLMSWLGYQRRLDLIKALRDNRIPYIVGKGGTVATTLDAINSALIGPGAPATISDPIEF